MAKLDSFFDYVILRRLLICAYRFEIVTTPGVDTVPQPHIVWASGRGVVQ